MSFAEYCNNRVISRSHIVPAIDHPVDMSDLFQINLKRNNHD
jgi:hypothetical protein